SRKTSIFLINYLPVKPNGDDLLKTPASAHTNYLIIYFKERADRVGLLSKLDSVFVVVKRCPCQRGRILRIYRFSATLFREKVTFIAIHLKEV
ncbi:hypothetical protein V6259_17470, partial [Marinomonas sp. TI.3.20]|uniref:hypothetical protein n=1 Tax=Marinomonas sp. TI.3.20 TaxID=3121296 RepID=UPI00311F7627